VLTEPEPVGPFPAGLTPTVGVGVGVTVDVTVGVGAIDVGAIDVGAIDVGTDASCWSSSVDITTTATVATIAASARGAAIRRRRRDGRRGDGGPTDGGLVANAFGEPVASPGSISSIRSNRSICGRLPTSQILAPMPACTLAVVTDLPVQMYSQGPPRTVLPQEDAQILDALAAAATGPIELRRDAITAVVIAHPRSLFAWRALGDAGRDTMERYAAYRVGYHRGLDALRANGWRGSGYVRWADQTNLGFLGCLRGLGEMAATIDEQDEAERISLFLAQLDPSGPPPG
jgi:hypothetical protein